MIRRLYEVEDRARPLDDDARRALRQAEAVPILDRLREELDRLSSQAAAQVGAGASGDVCVEPMAGVVPVHGGRPADDRQQRVGAAAADQAIGRKNWMFLGSDEAGPRAAVLCTIIAGAKRHRLEPWAYMHDVSRPPLRGLSETRDPQLRRSGRRR